MIRRQLRIYVSLLALFLLCGFIVQAAAGDNNQLLKKKKSSNRAGMRSSGQFSVSGTFSGELKGAITIGGEKVFLSKNTAVRRVGGGKIKPGTRLKNVFVYTSGAVKHGIPTASLVLVRSNSGLGEQVMIRTNEDNKYAIPSKSNPKVGKLKENTPQ